MLRIAICDDSRAEAELLKDAIEKVVFAYMEYCFVFYSDGKQFIEDLSENHRNYDLVFLDIHMPQCDGLTVAQHIRKKELDMDIIFYSISSDYIFEGYTYKAFSYLLKPLDVIRLREEMGRYLEERSTVSHCLNVKIQGNNVKIPLKKVWYFVSEGRKVRAVMDDETIEFYDKLSEVIQLVEGEGFIRCHQSYIVNVKYIRSHSLSTIELEDGSKLPVSRPYQKRLKDFGIQQYNARIQDEKLWEKRITKSLAVNQEKVGSLVFVKGEYLGSMIRIEPKEVVLLGRDPKSCNIVMKASDISRRHCNISFNQRKNKYYIKDFSTNGTYVDGKRLEKEKIYEVNAESKVVLGKGGQELILG